MKYVIGIDLGTSSVKVLLVNQKGKVCQEVSESYPLIQEKSGYSEQNPEEWVTKTKKALSILIEQFNGDVKDIEGISFSGQMHGLVLIDKNYELLGNSILWNDTRTTKQCQDIYNVINKEKLLEITGNPALEGFTLPKLLWIKENESELYEEIFYFMLPKDYLRYRLTGELHSEYSDAAGTLLLDINNKKWSDDICNLFDISREICPPLVESSDYVGTIKSTIAAEIGLHPSTRIFAGAADNACGAIGSGILSEGKTLCSIGTSGVILTYEESNNCDFEGQVHYFNHGAENAYYTMGVTLAAGQSLDWFKNTFAEKESFEGLLEGIENIPIGANGLLFTPYLTGERTPHADSMIRASFIGMDHTHSKKDFVRAVLEGITFSLNESIQIFRDYGKEIDAIVSIGGGAKNSEWLQIQADIFDAKIIKLSSEQGPAMGAAILAAYGCGWKQSMQECADLFIEPVKVFTPIKENVERYKDLFLIYTQVYLNTKELNEDLYSFR